VSAEILSEYGSIVPLDLADILLNYVLPMLLTVFLWVRYLGTPGKILMNCSVVKSSTCQPMGVVQAFIRYIAYMVSILTLGLGFLWIAGHPRKQSFHDMLARTLVITDTDDLSQKSLHDLIKEYR